MHFTSPLISYAQLGIRSRDSLKASFFDLEIEVGSFPVSMFRFEYETTCPLGKKTLASASLSLPISSVEEFPILSYQHGTETLKDQVSSVQGFDTPGDGTIASLFASKGFATILPDYLGLGVSKGLHPYLHAESLAASVKDAIAAAIPICKSSGFKLSGQLFLAGYSEGGHATMAAQRLLEQSPLSNIQLVASAPMGGPYDLSGTMLNLMLSRTPYPAPAYAPYILLAYNHAYSLSAKLEDLFAKPYCKILPQLFDGKHSREEIEKHLPEIPIDVLRKDVIDAIASDTDHPVRVALQKNDTFRFKPRTPTHLFHCPGDQTVPIKNALVAHHYMSKVAEAEVSITEVEAESHSAAALPCILKSIVLFNGGT